MLRGLYTATSGMIAQQRHQEALSNNMANVNTPGYKADQTTLRSFPEMLIRQLGKRTIPTTNELTLPVNNPVGSLNTGVYVQETVPHFAQGSLKETGLSTDLALINGVMPDETGNIFFTVQNENGDIRYSRNGNFTVDGEGYLTTHNGFYVLDNNNNRIFTDGLDFTVTSEGDLLIGDNTVSLNIAYIENANDLVKEGNDLYNGDDAQVVNANDSDARYSIEQGVLEGSNVDTAQTMSQMIQAYRAFEMNQRVLKAYDDSLGKAVNDIGRIG